MIYKNNTLYSEKFDDFYFNSDSPVGESEFVFASVLNEIWDSKSEFIVAETGFGIGRNFLTLCKKFAKSGKKLHFVSIEKYPFKKSELKEIYSKFGEFNGFWQKLIKKYPKNLINGINRINFSKNIILDLCIGDVGEVLDELEFSGDIWFLDGFSPSKNQEMWSDEIIFKIANLSKIGTKIATYTSARSVANSLKKNGFEVWKVQGFGKKREMIRAKKIKNNEFIKNSHFSRPKTSINLPKKTSVLVRGAGIAGLATATKLKKLGFRVKIAEKQGEVATNGSSNFCGVAEPLITKDGVKLGEMHICASLQAYQFYKKFIPKKLIKFSGVKEFAYDDELKNRYKNAKSKLFKFCQKSAKNEPYDYIFIKNGALARPKKICKFLSKKFEILFSHEFINFTRKNEKYEVKFSTPKGEKIEFCDILIFACGSHSEELFGKGQNPKTNLNKFVQISSVRGQTTLLKPCVKTKIPLSARGYICPAIKNRQLIGATYDRLLYHDGSRKEDDLRNLESISEFVYKKTKILKSNVGYRSYSGDRFPLVGAFVSENEFIRDFKSLPWTKNKPSNLRPKYLPNLYITTAHGSRGLTTAILGAELLCDYILNRPLCVVKSVANELNPNRFLIRKLKKGLVK